MSKYIKIALALIGAGIILLVVGNMFGGKGFVISSDLKAYSIEDYQIFEYKNMEIDELESIHIDVQNVPVTFCMAEGDKYGVEVRYQVMEEDDIKVLVEDKKLTVNADERMFWISYDFSFLDKDADAEEYVIVYVPKFSGVEETVITTSNAPVVMDEPGSKLFNLHIVTSNGSVTVDKTYVVDELSIKTSNAKIQVDDSVCSYKAKFSTSNGSVIIEGSELDAVEINTSNGKIEVDDSWFHGENQKLDAKTSNAGIRVEFSKHEEKEFSIYAKTSNADISVNNKELDDNKYETKNGPIELKLKTSNGDVEMNFK